MNICTANDMHPYECERAGKCEHCDKKEYEGHDPKLCALCAE